jgi:hypothetical protein
MISKNAWLSLSSVWLSMAQGLQVPHCGIRSEPTRVKTPIDPAPSPMEQVYIAKAW